MGGHCTWELHGAAAVESIAMDGQSIGSEVVAAVESIVMDGQSIGSEVVAAVTHNSESQ